MPLEDRELRTLARRSGYLTPGQEAELLLRDYTDHTHKVRSIYDDLFAFSGEDSSPQTAMHEYDLLLDASISEQESVAAFARFGFRDPGKAYRNLLMLREGRPLSTRRRGAASCSTTFFLRCFTRSHPRPIRTWR